jgi:hypothetical protein
MARLSNTKGNAGDAKARKAGRAKARKTAKANTVKTRRRVAPAAQLPKRRSVSNLTKELKEAQERQAATAEILKVINASPGVLSPVSISSWRRRIACARSHRAAWSSLKAI